MSKHRHQERLPHPIPYQGSKRKLANAILSVVRGREIRTLYEPFAGSAALTIAAAHARLSARHVIADSLEPLIEVWRSILASPTELATTYACVWNGQRPDDEGYYSRVRERFNDQGNPADLLYLLARCVKNSPRWNRDGHFNQSADQRRLGMAPDKMLRAISGAHWLLRGKADAVSGDFEQTIADAKPHDLVYMDPPYEGTSGSRDSRYHQGLDRARLLGALENLNQRGVPWILSYDGRCGERTYGSPLPSSLRATHIELDAGRSSQATLNGVEAITVESLYVSEHVGVGTAICWAAPPRPPLPLKVGVSAARCAKGAAEVEITDAPNAAGIRYANLRARRP